jgi:hypothetical protein
MVDRTLKIGITGTLDCKYARTDVLGGSAGHRGDVLYTALRRNFANGRGGRLKVDLLYSKTYNLNNSVLSLNLDGGLTNVWGDVLNYDAVKVIMIQNLETSPGRYLSVRFKDERYYIGPEGYRLIIEPDGSGIDAIVSSSSSEEGVMIFSCDTDINFDLIIAGASQESSSSSGL